jgi:hypothetical protein
MCTLRDLAEGDPEITDVVLDLPPGTWGFAHTALVAMLALEAKGGASRDGGGSDAIRWVINPILVTSADRNALLPTLEYLAANDHHFGPTGLRPVINRATEAPEATRRRVPFMLPEPLNRLGLEERLVFVSESGEMARIFQGPAVGPGAPGSTAPNLVSALRLK